MRHTIILILVSAAVALSVVVIGLLGIFQAPTAPTGPRPKSDRISGRDAGTDALPLVPSGSVIGEWRVVNITVRSFKFDPSPVVVRQGEKVRLEAVSKDIPHNILIPDLGIDRTLEPMKPETITFTARKTGRYVMACSVNCGLGAEDLEGLLIILPKEEAEKPAETQDQ